MFVNFLKKPSMLPLPILFETHLLIKIMSLFILVGISLFFSNIWLLFILLISIIILRLHLPNPTPKYRYPYIKIITILIVYTVLCFLLLESRVALTFILIALLIVLYIDIIKQTTSSGMWISCLTHLLGSHLGIKIYIYFKTQKQRNSYTEQISLIYSKFKNRQDQLEFKYHTNRLFNQKKELLIEKYKMNAHTKGITSADGIMILLHIVLILFVVVNGGS